MRGLAGWKWVKRAANHGQWRNKTKLTVGINTHKCPLMSLTTILSSLICQNQQNWSQINVNSFRVTRVNQYNELFNVKCLVQIADYGRSADPVVKEINRCECTPSMFTWSVLGESLLFNYFFYLFLSSSPCRLLCRERVYEIQRGVRIRFKGLQDKWHHKNMPKVCPLHHSDFKIINRI